MLSPLQCTRLKNLGEEDASIDLVSSSNVELYSYEYEMTSLCHNSPHLDKHNASCKQHVIGT